MPRVCFPPVTTRSPSLSFDAPAWWLGPGTPGSVWDTPWRESLVGNLEIMTRQLWQVGVHEVFADGSFVEEKAHPNDIDGYFVCKLEDLTSRLALATFKSARSF